MEQRDYKIVFLQHVLRCVRFWLKISILRAGRNYHSRKLECYILRWSSQLHCTSQLMSDWNNKCSNFSCLISVSCSFFICYIKISVSSIKLKGIELETKDNKFNAASNAGFDVCYWNISSLQWVYLHWKFLWKLGNYSNYIHRVPKNIMSATNMGCYFLFIHKIQSKLPTGALHLPSC